MPLAITALYRYPVKGLSPEPLEHATLTPFACLPHDRRFALARAETRIDPERPEWLHKSRFFMLMRDEKLARVGDGGHSRRIAFRSGGEGVAVGGQSEAEH